MPLNIGVKHVESTMLISCSNVNIRLYYVHLFYYLSIKIWNNIANYATLNNGMHPQGIFFIKRRLFLYGMGRTEKSATFYFLMGRTNHLLLVTVHCTLSVFFLVSMEYFAGLGYQFALLPYGSQD